MLIYVKNIKKKKLFTDGQTDGRTTQNYSSEPHNIREKITKNINFQKRPNMSFYGLK